ncbi:MAG: DnaB-like helicase C-terminal domain-containing protein [Gammaproteobacteria bacterium]|nr:DnaB-like helicase C-terminal domain-containing protein [Gammaproteobacteria bacterium]
MAKSIRKIGEFLPTVLERVRPGNEARRGLQGVATGLRRLDQLTGGWHKGDLIVIGGRPSMGKTALACQFALHAALDPQIPVIYFSLDLSREGLALRLTAALAGVHLQRLRAAQLDAKEWEQVEIASQQLATSPLYLDDTAQSISDIYVRARFAANEYGIGLAIVDFLQAISPARAADPSAKPVESSTALKSLARELRVPIIALSKLNRWAESRQYPLLSDLSGSSAIEDDADIVMMLYREDVYRDHTPREGTADISIVKHRNGPPRTIWTFFRPETCSFKEIG